MLIAISRGLYAQIDDEDAHLVEDHKWCARPKFSGSDCFYAQRGKWPNKTIYMHRLIIGAAPGQIVDHINGQGLDNRRLNLRIATAAQNNANRTGYTPKSGYRGVSHERGKYRAILYQGGRSITLGTFIDPVEAAQAYDRAAASAHGQFATLNFPVGA